MCKTLSFTVFCLFYATFEMRERSVMSMSFYRAFNAIFGKVGRIASEDVIIELLKAKCLSALYYGLEACPVNKSQIRSLECPQQYF